MADALTTDNEKDIGTYDQLAGGADAISILGVNTDTGMAGLLDIPRLRILLATPAQPANKPPTIQLEAIPAQVDAGQELTLYSHATDTDGYIKEVEFFEGGLSLGKVASAPFALKTTPASSGLLVYTAIATDNAGAKVDSDVVRVSVAPVPKAPGEMVLTAVAGAGLQINLDKRFTPSENGSPITGYDLFKEDGTTSLATGIQFPYVYTAPASGNYLFTARAVNAKGPGPISEAAGPVTVPAGGGGGGGGGGGTTPAPTYNTSLSQAQPNDPAGECTLTLVPGYEALTLSFNSNAGGDPTAKSMNVFIGPDQVALLDFPIGYVGAGFRVDFGGHIYTSTIADGNVTLTLFS